MDAINLSQVRNAQPVNFGKTQKVVTEAVKDYENDTLEFSKSSKELTKKDKQQILKKARVDSSLVAMIGGGPAIAYYSLRKDETIAKKYNLDIEKDKEFINVIRGQQVMYSLPSITPAWSGNFFSFATFLYNMFFVKPENINVNQIASL